jgi:hypothetical protein
MDIHKFSELTKHWPWHRKLKVWIRVRFALAGMWCRDNLPWTGR